MDPSESELSTTPTRNVPSTFLYGKAVACSTPIAQSFNEHSLSESLSTVLMQETNADSSGGFFNSDIDTVVESENTITSMINKSCEENNNWNKEPRIPTGTELIAPENQVHLVKTVGDIVMDKNNVIGISDMSKGTLTHGEEKSKAVELKIETSKPDFKPVTKCSNTNNEMLKGIINACDSKRFNKCSNVAEMNNNEISFKNIQSVIVNNEKTAERELKHSECQEMDIYKNSAPEFKHDQTILINGDEFIVVEEASTDVNGGKKYPAEQLKNSCSVKKECGINTITSGQGEKNMCSDKVVNTQKSLNKKKSTINCLIVAKIVGDPNVKTDAVECKNKPSTYNYISYNNQPKNNILCGSSSKPLKSTQSNNSKKNIDKIANEEVNLTVTEDDIYYSRKDEISVSFDTRNDPLLKDSSFKKKKPKRRSRGKASKANKVLEFDVSNLKKTLEREVKPPPAKRVRLDPSPVSAERPLEVFVSNNACENADNNDPQWQMYKKLTNDELRYECVRQKWCNLQIPNCNENLSIYNWRARNELSPPRYTKNNVESYYCTSGGGIRDIFAKARSDAKSLYDEKFRIVERLRDQRYEAADEEYHYFSLYGANRYMRAESYRNFRYVYDSIKNDFEDQHEALLGGLEVRVGAINRAEEEATTVSNFYKGLNARGGASRTHLNSWQLSCWFDREDILNQYEMIYSDQIET